MKKILAMLLALMLVLSMLTVAVFAEGGDNVSDEEGDDINVSDTVDEPTTQPDAVPVADRNPITGVAVAVVPMMVAAAAAVVAKKH